MVPGQSANCPLARIQQDIELAASGQYLMAASGQITMTVSNLVWNVRHVGYPATA